MTTSLTKFSLALLVMLATEKASSESNAYGKVTSKSFAKKLRGSSSFSTTTGPYHRVLPKGPPHPHHGGGHHSSYLGCLGYTSEELQESWSFYGAAPDCSYTRPDDGSGGGGNGDGYDDDATEIQYDTSEDDADETGNGGDGNDRDDNGGGSDANGDSSYEVVVTNEDVVNGTEYDVYEDFNVTQCGTYGNLWKWDLSLSCSNSFSFDGCNCSFAEELVSAGLLDCDDGSQCPDDCPICGTCLNLLGCNVTNAPSFRVPGQSTGMDTSSILYIVGAVLVFLILAVIAYRARSATKDASDMTKSLMAGEDVVANLVAKESGLNSSSPTWVPPSVGSSESIESPTTAGAAGAGALGMYAMTKMAAKQKDNGDDSSSVGSYSGTAPTMDESTVPEGASQYDGSAHVVYSHHKGGDSVEEEDNEAPDDAVDNELEEQSVTPFEEDLRPETPKPPEADGSGEPVSSEPVEEPPKTSTSAVTTEDDASEYDDEELTPFEEDQLSDDEAGLPKGKLDDEAAMNILSDTGADEPPASP